VVLQVSSLELRRPCRGRGFPRRGRCEVDRRPLRASQARLFRRGHV